MNFKQLWKGNYFEKSSGDFSELIKRQSEIASLKRRGVRVTKEIAELHKLNKELLKERHEKLDEDEIHFVRSMIEDSREIGMSSSKTITRIQTNIYKLRFRWRAERAYWTEVKKDDTEAVKDIGEEAGFDKYKIILSPIACAICRRKTDGGRKVFTQKELSLEGYGHAPPFHPSCYCIAVPEV